MIYLIRGQYPVYIKNSHNSTPKKQTTRSKNGQKVSTDIFQGICTGNLQTREKTPNICNCQGNAIKTTMRYHLVRRAIIKDPAPQKIKTNKQTKNLNQVSIDKNVEKKETIRHCRWEHELLQPPQKTVWSWLKISKIELPCCCCC